MAQPLAKSPEYQSLLASLKHRIQEAQVRAGLAVNRELVLLYWSIGREILSRQQAQGWGAKVIDSLAKDLRREFPGMQGLSPRNLKYMRAFAEAWPDEGFVQRLVAQMPWFHNCVLLDKVKAREGAPLAHPRNHRERLEPHRPCPPNRKWSLSPAGPGADELQARVARAPIRLGAAGAQGPIQLRLPDAIGGGQGTRPGAGSARPRSA